MSEQQSHPRSWGPLIAAGGIAAVVLLGAVVWTVTTGRPSDLEAAAIEACEAQYAASGGPAILGGEVYEPSAFAEYYAVAQTHGEVPAPLEEVDADRRAQWDAAASAYEETGDGEVIVVWRLEDDTYRQCVLAASGGEIDPTEVVIEDLDAAAEAP